MLIGRFLISMVVIVLLTPFPGAQVGVGEEKWAIEITRQPGSPPAIGFDGTLYAACYDHLIAFDPTGEQKWAFELGGEGVGPAIGPDGTIYIGSRANWRLRAIHPNGKRKWWVKVGGWPSAPAIGPDGTIYVSSWPRNDLLAFDPDGNEMWAYNTGGVVVRSPVVGPDGTIYLLTNLEEENGPQIEKTLHAVNPDGSEKWVTPLEADHMGGLISVSLAIGEDGTIYTSTSRYLVAINSDGTRRWKVYLGPTSCTSLIGTDGTIYSIGPDGLVALSPDGSLKWVFGMRMAYAEMVLGSDGTIYVGEVGDDLPTAFFYAITPEGAKKWAFSQLGADSYKYPTIGPDGTLYVTSLDFGGFGLGSRRVLHAIETGTRGMVVAPWPGPRNDFQGTGRQDGEGSEPLRFPQLADGGGIQSELVLTNPGSQRDAGIITFWGSTGLPLLLSTAGREAYAIPYELVPGGGTSYTDRWTWRSEDWICASLFPAG